MLERSTHVAGIGWRLLSPTGPFPVHARALRSGRSLVHCELVAVRDGARDARSLGAARFDLWVPGALTARLLQGGLGGRARRAQAAAARIREVLAGFDEVRIVHVRRVDPLLAQAIGEALDVGLHEVAERAERRREVLERILERAKEVRLEERDGGWVANGRYRVSLDPPRCECPAWTARWARAPIAGRRAQRLPCKHLVALAVAQGAGGPEDLLALARRAPR